MSVHEKLAARLREYASERGERAPFPGEIIALKGWADAIEAGDFDDILGVREPTIEDVVHDARRVHGAHARAIADDDKRVLVLIPRPIRDRLDEQIVFRAPTIAAAYAALRELPDYEGEK